MSALAARQQAVQRHLFRLIGKELGAVSLLAGDHSADERMAAFLVGPCTRYTTGGPPATRFHLSMSRGDIANYLRLAAGTVSRVLGRFRSQGLIVLEGSGWCCAAWAACTSSAPACCRSERVPIRTRTTVIRPSRRADTSCNVERLGGPTVATCPR